VAGGKKTEMLNPCQWALAEMTAADSPKGAMSESEQFKI
jgi:hypothetical protein